MTRALLVLNNDAERAKAVAWVQKAPVGTRVEMKAPKRTLPQNERMWAMLSDIAAQLRWHGLKLTPEDWKLVFMDALRREVRMVPNIDGTGFVNIGVSSSDLSVTEFSDLIDLISAFAAKHNVVFRWEPQSIGELGADVIANLARTRAGREASR